MSSRVLVSALSAASEATPAAATIAIAMAADRGGALLVDLTGGREWRAGVLASDPARRAAARIEASDAGLRAFPRGRLCIVVVAPDLVPAEAEAAVQAAAPAMPLVQLLPAPRLQPAVHAPGAGPAAVLIQATPAEPKALAALAVIELRRAGVPVKVWRRSPPAIAARRALSGLEPGGDLGRRARRTAAALSSPPARSPGARPPIGTAVRAPAEAGQAIPAVLGLIAMVAILAFALVAIGGGATAKGRAQRAADLAAVSAARSMRDDFDRLFTPARRPDGSLDPRHLDRAEYMLRAERAAREAARHNGLPVAGLEVGFPDAREIAPLRVEVRAEPRIRIAGSGPGERTTVAARAAIAPGAPGAGAEVASGGGYGGPLAERQGKRMRPDVAAAFDRLSAAAARAGHSLTINSAFRSDSEQAKLFAANPDPRWVAPPGKSLHRCATELDLGPPTAHAWLAANAERFGFRRRYSWEPWHFGFIDGPAPCSAAAERGGATSMAGRAGDGRSAGSSGLPGFVPRRYRDALRDAAARRGVSAALLAAQLMAESNFNPAAVSSAGAQGIAQFMPATAAAYGLADPFDWRRAIDAQARLMADLLEQFGTPALALAAYNAGPAAVAACECIPPYPETQAYVARILGLLGGAGELAGPAPLEVRLIA